MSGNEFGFDQYVDFTIDRALKPSNNFNPFGNVIVEHYREGQLLDIYKIHNDITNEGKNTIYGVMFFSQTQILTGSWFVGLINATGYTGVQATDVMTSHSGWAEWTNYTQATRVAWTPGAPANQSISNPGADTFNMNQNGSLQGVFIVSDGTKGGTAGKIWATALFSATVSVNNGDQLNTTYTCSS